MEGCSRPLGKGSLQLSFTAIMGHVRLILSPLFTHKRCVSWPENDITSCLWAIDWATGPRGILTDAPLTILTGAPLTLPSDSCIFQTRKVNGGLNFHQSNQDMMWCFKVLTNQIFLYYFISSSFFPQWHPVLPYLFLNIVPVLHII